MTYVRSEYKAAESEQRKMNYRSFFPILTNNPDVIYLDSAATTQRPAIVLDAERKYVENICANSGRGSYPWAYHTSKLVSEIREKVGAFIGGDPSEVAFTSGTTMSINLVALSWGAANLQDGDEILYCPLDHKSMNTPWFRLKDRLDKLGIKIELKPYPLSSSGAIDLPALDGLISKRTKLINLTHINNVAGVLNDLSHIRSILPRSVLMNVDCAQSISHIPLDVKKTGADFLSFSGHKMYSATGTGILWIKKELHKQIYPIFWGGGQADAKELDQFSLNERLECGTLNIQGIISLGAAIEFIQNIGSKELSEHNFSLTSYLYDRLLAERSVQLMYPEESKMKCGLASFNLDGYSSTDIGDYLSSKNIFVRHGTHCSSVDSLSTDEKKESVRISLGLYNNIDDIDTFINQLRSLPKIGDHV